MVWAFFSSSFFSFRILILLRGQNWNGYNRGSIISVIIKTNNCMSFFSSVQDLIDSTRITLFLKTMAVVARKNKNVIDMSVLKKTSAMIFNACGIVDLVRILFYIRTLFICRFFLNNRTKRGHSRCKINW